MNNHPSSQLPPIWRGIHHIALATPDLDATVTFYRDVLGMEASDIYPSRSGRGRHALIFVKPGDPETWGLHFFERAVDVENQSQPHSNPAELLPLNSGAGLMLHIAFRLLDAASAEALRERLRLHQMAITEIEELGSFVFHDNNGIVLEATWNKN